MKLTYSPTPEELSEFRRAGYLKAWPVEAQLEALTDAASGRPEKLARLLDALKAVKDLYPKKGENS